VRGLKRRAVRDSSDRRNDHTRLSRGKLLARGSIKSLSPKGIFRRTDRHRFARQQGIDGANLAVTLANKVPVDLNFTMGRAANESCCRRANLRVAISATHSWNDSRIFRGRNAS